jgi:hypothetical protein
VPDYLVGLIAGAFIAGGGFVFTVMKYFDMRRRFHALEAQVSKLTSCSKHDLAYLIRRDAGEASLFDLARVREQAKLLNDWVEYATQRGTLGSIVKMILIAGLGMLFGVCYFVANFMPQGMNP